MERLIVIILLTVAAFCGYSAETKLPLDRLKQGMSKVKTFSADYNELKKFKILTRPVKLSGRLYIQRKPFKLGWHVDSPVKCLTVIDSDKLVQWDESSNKKNVLKMDGNPVLKTVSQTYQAMLLGNFAEFAKNCKLSFDDKSNSLSVVPEKKSGMGRFITKIIFYFEPDLTYLKKIDITETRGNNTVISFSNIIVNSPLPPSAWQTNNED